jgi:hypothetical protein
MTARAYSTPEPDFTFQEDVPTLKVKAQCRCGVRAVGSFQIAEEFARKVMLREIIYPHELAGSAWCRDCKTLVKVTARALHLA